MRSWLPVLALRDAVHFPGLVDTLLVVREPSVRALKKATSGDRHVIVLSQRDMTVDDPKPCDLCSVGIVSEMLQSMPLPDSRVRAVLRGRRRVAAKRIVIRNGCFFAQPEELGEKEFTGDQADALTRTAIEIFNRVVQLSETIPPESISAVAHATSVGTMADTILHHLPLKTFEKQALLETLDAEERLGETVRLLAREERILELKDGIRSRLDEQVASAQREYLLREQIRIIQKELSVPEGETDETAAYRARIVEGDLPSIPAERASAEVHRLERSGGSGPEAVVSRSYLDALLELPWNRSTQDRLDLVEARAKLDERHFGLDRVKDRILDFLAVRQLGGSSVGTVLCFQGPPGVGKTSVARSIADAMGRSFVRIALGGLRDEAEIRGHRRTYVGSMPGRIMRGVLESGYRNPVIVLDEIDKIADNASGDPHHALLEAFDPEQNRAYSDLYLEVPFDLREVLFIATANRLDSLSPALRDRMEVITFPSYTEQERLRIAIDHLLPDALSQAGLTTDRLEVEEDALRALVRRYTYEPGVRDLRRCIERICQKAARLVVEGVADRVQVGQNDLASLLGRPILRLISESENSGPGISWGMVVSEVGGAMIAIEVCLLPPTGETPHISLTGSLGDVLKESALTAFTHLQSLLDAPMRRDVHLHVPQGGIPKEGPSAGLAIFLAIASAYYGRPLKLGIASTGEITLRGRVIAVGGLRDKLLAAVASGIREVIVPAENAGDLDELPAEVLGSVKIHLVKTAAEALELALDHA